MKQGEAARRNHDLHTVVQYIYEHLDEKLRRRDLCAVAGVSTRTLEYLFLRVYATSPMAFVKRMRLYEANRLLRHADPRSSTVAGIALSCGFTHMGQFAMDYKRNFGETPSATLRLARLRTCRAKPVAH